MPWTMNEKPSLRRTLTSGGLPPRGIQPRASSTLFGLRPLVSRRPAPVLALDLRHCASRRLVHRDRAVAVLDAVAVEDLEPLLLPGTGDAEDCDGLAGVLPELEAGLDDPAGDDVHP